MRIKKDFEIVPLQNDLIAVPVGKAGEQFKGIIRMNTTGAFIWNAIRDGADTEEKILEKMQDAYEDLDEEIAKKDINQFLNAARVALEE